MSSYLKSISTKENDEKYEEKLETFPKSKLLSTPSLFCLNDYFVINTTSGCLHHCIYCYANPDCENYKNPKM